MKTRNLLLAAAVAALFAGCEMFGTMGGGVKGSSNVNTDISVAASGNSCTFQGTVPTINVGNGNSGNLVFHVKPANAFQFTSNGIDFSRSGAPAGEFAPVNSSPTTWTIHDRNKTAGTFKYDVHVIPKAQGGTECVLDPTVFNDGSCTDGC